MLPIGRCRVDDAVLDGREPSGLSLVKLTQPLPADWAEQRAQLGFKG